MRLYAYKSQTTTEKILALAPRNIEKKIYKNQCLVAGSLVNIILNISKDQGLSSGSVGSIPIKKLL